MAKILLVLPSPDSLLTSKIEGSSYGKYSVKFACGHYGEMTGLWDGVESYAGDCEDCENERQERADAKKWGEQYLTQLESDHHDASLKELVKIGIREIGAGRAPDYYVFDDGFGLTTD